MTNIIAISSAVPDYKHGQLDILQYMINAYELDAHEARKLSFLYRHSEIDSRYSVLPDFDQRAQAQVFSSRQHSPDLDARMNAYDKHAPLLSASALETALKNKIKAEEITHLITVSCTGMSAPGLDLQLLSRLGLRPNIFRTSVNFMGCYGAVQAMRMADLIAQSDAKAVVAIVATELCTLHFQHQYTPDNAGSSLLFGDGSAAVIISNNPRFQPIARLKSFYSTVAMAGWDEMSWTLSSKGFLMKLSGYVPKLIDADIEPLINDALQHAGIDMRSIKYWCIHPGGKKILDNIQRRLALNDEDLFAARSILRQYGNMSSPTVLFVLQQLIEKQTGDAGFFMGMAFGPGLTMETFCGEIV